MANNTGTFFNINDNDGIPLVGVSTNGKVMINHLYGNCLIGSTSVTGTADQKLQVTGSAYVSGNLGIGTINPVHKLHAVYNNNDIALSTGAIPVPGIVLQNSGGDAALWLGNDNRVNAGLGILANNGSVIDLSGKYSSIDTYGSFTFGRIGAFKENNTSGDYSGYLSLYSRSSSQNLTEALRIDSSQRVGIGTTNPTSKLHVVGGDIRVGINTSSGVILTDENGTKYRLIVSTAGILSTVLVA